ncbi:MAG: DMT family transporter [Deltaproteobacteria bacterium]|nr:DMT family transporter [Deltaproteobacteria bacterium]
MVHGGPRLRPEVGRTHLILVAAQVCFGSLPVVGRLALLRIRPEALVLVRVFFGALAFAVIARLLGSSVPPRANRGRLLACALLGVVINQEMFVGGLARSTAINASVLGTTIPIFTALAAVALGKERPSVERIAGIAIALSGALVLLRVEGASLDDSHLLGNLMILVNSISYGLFLVIVRPLSAEVPAFALTAALFAIATPFVAMPGLVAWQATPELTLEELGFLAFIVAVPTVGAYALTQMALARAEASLVASYVYLQPVVAAVGAAVVLGERPGLRTLAGAALIFSGVFASSRAPAKGG